jgi:hypothetical protein
MAFQQARALIATSRRPAKRSRDSVPFRVRPMLATYVEARSSFWRKVKVKQEDEFVIVGYTAPGGSRSHFGALLLGPTTMIKVAVR